MSLHEEGKREREKQKQKRGLQRQNSKLMEEFYCILKMLIPLVVSVWASNLTSPVSISLRIRFPATSKVAINRPSGWKSKLTNSSTLCNYDEIRNSERIISTRFLRWPAWPAQQSDLIISIFGVTGVRNLIEMITYLISDSVDCQ